MIYTFNKTKRGETGFDISLAGEFIFPPPPTLPTPPSPPLCLLHLFSGRARRDDARASLRLLSLSALWRDAEPRPVCFFPPLNFKKKRCHKSLTVRFHFPSRHQMFWFVAPNHKKKNDKCMHACFTSRSGRRVADCRSTVPAPSVRKCKKNMLLKWQKERVFSGKNCRVNSRSNERRRRSCNHRSFKSSVCELWQRKNKKL